MVPGLEPSLVDRTAKWTAHGDYAKRTLQCAMEPSQRVINYTLFFFAFAEHNCAYLFFSFISSN
jgi:hypothetical protein